MTNTIDYYPVKRAKWTRASYYTSLNGINDFQWAWEFLRRNGLYCDDYEKYGNITEEVTEEISDKEAKKWGLLNGYIDPKLSNKFIKNTRPMMLFDVCAAIAYGNVVNLRRYSSAFREEKIHIRDGQIAYVFDLTSPIGDQVEFVKKDLIDNQKIILKQHGMKVINLHKHKKNWPEYIRILDGRASGASYREIGEIVYPGNLDPGDRAKKAYGAAKTLSERGYQQIAMLRPPEK